MSLTRSGMSRFGSRIEKVMSELFPGTVVIEDVAYECACSGGRVFREFDDNGLPVDRRIFMIRVRKDLLSEARLPAIGDKIRWQPEGGPERTGRVRELPDRPHEEAWALEVREV